MRRYRASFDRKIARVIRHLAGRPHSRKSPASARCGNCHTRADPAASPKAWPGPWNFRRVLGAVHPRHTSCTLWPEKYFGNRRVRRASSPKSCPIARNHAKRPAPSLWPAAVFAKIHTPHRREAFPRQNSSALHLCTRPAPSPFFPRQRNCPDRPMSPESPSPTPSPHQSDTPPKSPAYFFFSSFRHPP